MSQTTSATGRRFVDPGPRQPVLRWVVELGPAYLVALAILPWVIAHGVAWPWQPSTIDLQVYVYAVRDMLAGRDIYATATPGWNLPFIYPPIAAVLLVPLAIGPYWLWQLLWTFLLVWAQQSVLKRCGVPRGWVLGLIGVVVVIAVEPIRTTLGYGQVNTLLMALVVADLLPDRPPGRGPDRPPPGLRPQGEGSGLRPPGRSPGLRPTEGDRRRIPRGTLIGLAAAIKLTPALFVVFAYLAGRRRTAITGVISFLAFTLVGAIVQWSPTVVFWSSIAVGDTRTPNSPYYVGNQSLLGTVTRFAGATDVATTLLGLTLSALVALTGAVVAAHWWRRGEQVFAVALVGLCTCLASPVTWTHHYVWVLPLGAAVLLRRTLPRWVRVLSGCWVVWVTLCLPLALLPYGYDAELRYTPVQELVANLGPLLGLALLVGLLGQMVNAQRRRAVAAVT